VEVGWRQGGSGGWCGAKLLASYADKDPHSNQTPSAANAQPHSDGPLYLPVVSILSLGSPCVIRFWKKQDEGEVDVSYQVSCHAASTVNSHARVTHAPLPGGTGGLPPRAALALPPRSLFVFSGDAYETSLHGIEEVSQERLDASVLNRDSPWPKEASIAAAAAAAAAAGGAGGGGSSREVVDALVAARECCCWTGESAEERRRAGAQSGQQLAAAAAAAAAAARDSTVAASTSSSDRVSAEGSGIVGGHSDALLPRKGERLSLTIRRVLKVHKGLRLPGAVR
jgi:hypothetical protein